ncbi:MAG: hypothetical protein ACP5GU_08045 [Thermoprotei archaeon]
MSIKFSQDFLRKYKPLLSLSEKPSESITKQVLREGAVIMMREDKTEVRVMGYDVILASPIPNAEIKEVRSSRYRIPMKTVSYGIIGVFIDGEENAQKLAQPGKIFILAGILQKRRVGEEIMYSLSCLDFEEVA